MSFLRILVVLSLSSCLQVLSQAPSRRAPQPFEVASIRPHDPKIPGPTIIIPLGGGEVSISGMTLKNLIMFAYNLRGYQVVGGPKWLDSDSDRYDIRAKPDQSELASGRTQKDDLEDQRVRIQLLLADRFGLKVHHETRQEPVYFLTVAKAGLKMQPHTEGAKTSKGSIVSWPLVVTTLEMRVGTPIVDETKLSGVYYLMLRYRGDDGQPMSVGVVPDESDPGPSLFTAVQEQLGLRLQAGKGPVDALVIDSINKPSEN